jgi:hypothetical protein
VALDETIGARRAVVGKRVTSRALGAVDATLRSG